MQCSFNEIQLTTELHSVASFPYILLIIIIIFICYIEYSLKHANSYFVNKTKYLIKYMLCAMERVLFNNKL